MNALRAVAGSKPVMGSLAIASSTNVVVQPLSMSDWQRSRDRSRLLPAREAIPEIVPCQRRCFAAGYRESLRESRDLWKALFG